MSSRRSWRSPVRVKSLVVLDPRPLDVLEREDVRPPVPLDDDRLQPLAGEHALRDPRGLVGLAEAFLPRVPADEFLYFVEHAEQHLLPPDPDEKSEFEFGLDLIVDGLERLRDEG